MSKRSRYEYHGGPLLSARIERAPMLSTVDASDRAEAARRIAARRQRCALRMPPANWQAHICQGLAYGMQFCGPRTSTPAGPSHSPTGVG
jgi:hypothetical protein